MATVDIIIICLIALPSIVGVCYGFLNIIFSMLSWLLAFFFAVKFLPYFSPLLDNHIDQPLLSMGLSFISLFILNLLILNGISFFIVRLLGKAGLTATDRILGLFFGMTLGILIVLVIVFLAGFTAIPQDEWWHGSKLLVSFERISIWCSQYLPEAMAEHHSY